LNRSLDSLKRSLNFLLRNTLAHLKEKFAN